MQPLPLAIVTVVPALEPVAPEPETEEPEAPVPEEPVLEALEPEAPGLEALEPDEPGVLPVTPDDPPDRLDVVAEPEDFSAVIISVIPGCTVKERAFADAPSALEPLEPLMALDEPDPLEVPDEPGVEEEAPAEEVPELVALLEPRPLAEPLPDVAPLMLESTILQGALMLLAAEEREPLELAPGEALCALAPIAVSDAVSAAAATDVHNFVMLNSRFNR